MKLGFIGCVRSPRPIVALSLQSGALSIFDMEKAKASEQMPLLLWRKSALCGNDLCHVPLIMVMIALEGVSWDVIQRAAEREWQGHPKWQ